MNRIGESLGSTLSKVLPAVVFGALFLGFWEWAVRFFELKPYFLTAPSSIWDQFTTNFSLIRGAATVSGTNALVGLVAGTVLGVAMSFVLSRFGFLNQLITPLAVALNA
ncbi:MAG: ABC transporter permease, partial [Actinomycetota bacterium]